MLAGVNPDTLRVGEEFRWRWAWWQLQRFTFRSGVQQTKIALELPAPELEPVEVTKTWSEKVAQATTPRPAKTLLA